MSDRIARNVVVAATLAAAGSAQAAYEVRTLTLPDSVVDGAGLGSATLQVGTDQDMAFVRARAVALKTFHGTYVVCDGGGNGDANANSEEIGTPETFIMLEFSDGSVAFKASGAGYFLRAANGGGSSANCQTSMAGGFTRFTPVEQSDGTYAFQALYGQYLAAEDHGDLNANRPTIGDWERFTIIDLGAARSDAMPDLAVRFHDADGDGDEEMVLMVTAEDGTGFLMTDPLGIADTMHQAGYRIGDNNDFWNALSATQRLQLRYQANQLGSYGHHISGPELRDVLRRMVGADRTYDTAEYTVTLDHTFVAAGTCWESMCAQVSVGDQDVTMDDGAIVELAVAQVSLSAGGAVKVEAEALGTSMGVVVADNRVAWGGEASLIAVEFIAGDEDGTYAGLSADVGVGFWADAAWGNNDQYGFALEIPVIPVGVAIFVKGDDAAWLGEVVADWTTGAYETAADAAEAAWNASIGWAEAAGDNIAITVSDTTSDAVSTLQVTGNTVVAGLSDGSDRVLSVLDGAADDIASSLSDFTDAAANVFNGVPGAVEDFAESLGDAAGDVIDDARDFFCGLFGC